MSFAQSVKKDFNTMTWTLIPVAMVIDIVIGQLVSTLKLPLFLDTIGTILVGIVCGPWAGALTGAVSHIVWGLFTPSILPFFPVAAWIGFAAGVCARYGLFRSWWKAVIVGLILAVTTSFVATPIVVYVFGGIEGFGTTAIKAVLVKSGQQFMSAALYKNMLIEPLDKVPSALLAYFIAVGLPLSLRTRFARPENLEQAKQKASSGF